MRQRAGFPRLRKKFSLERKWSLPRQTNPTWGWSYEHHKLSGLSGWYESEIEVADDFDQTPVELIQTFEGVEWGVCCWDTHVLLWVADPGQKAYQ